VGGSHPIYFFQLVPVPYSACACSLFLLYFIYIKKPGRAIAQVVRGNLLPVMTVNVFLAVVFVSNLGFLPSTFFSPVVVLLKIKHPVHDPSDKVPVFVISTVGFTVDSCDKKSKDLSKIIVHLQPFWEDLRSSPVSLPAIFLQPSPIF